MHSRWVTASYFLSVETHISFKALISPNNFFFLPRSNIFLIYILLKLSAINKDCVESHEKCEKNCQHSRVDFWPTRSIFPIYPFCLSPSPSVKAFQVREFHRMPKVIKNCLMNKPLNNRMLLRWEKVGRKLCALRKYSPHFATFIRSFHAILCHKLNETLFKYYHKIAQVFFTFDLFIQWPPFYNLYSLWMSTTMEEKRKKKEC